MHRQSMGKIKTCTVRKKPSGEWALILSCEVEQEHLPLKQEAIGIGVGLTHFSVLSHGQEIDNPRFFQKGQTTFGVF